MKRIAVLLLAAVTALTPDAAHAAIRRSTETSILTRAAPSNETTLANGIYPETEGVDLAGASGYRVCVAANSGATLSGGTIKQYVYSYHTGLWGEADAALTKTVTSTTRSQCWDFEVTVRSGRVLPATVSVTVSAGTTVAVSVLVSYAEN